MDRDYLKSKKKSKMMCFLKGQKTATTMNSSNTQSLPPASFFRLLGSWMYDGLLLFALWLLAGVVYIIPAQFFINIDASSTQNLSTTAFTGPMFYIYMFLVTWFFFAWFWVHGGQTLGLRSWSLRLQTKDGYAINWSQSLLRFLIAGSPWLLALFAFSYAKQVEWISPGHRYWLLLIGFIGLIWTFIDKQGRSLQDICTGTQIVKLPKKTKS